MSRITSLVTELIPRRSTSSSSTATLSSTSSLPLAAMSNLSISSGSSQHTTLDWDTGFPDSFSSITTSQRFPGAKVGVHACIEAEDVDPRRAMDRSKHRLLMKHRRTTSSGRLAHSNLSTIFSNDGGIIVEEDGQHVEGDNVQAQQATAAAPSTHLDIPSSPTSSQEEREKRRSIFRWRGH